jgi:hypothetical protein
MLFSLFEKKMNIYASALFFTHKNKNKWEKEFY